MDLQPLTPQEVEVLQFIGQALAQLEAAPSRAEIGDEFGVTPQRAHNILFSLIGKGYCNPQLGKHHAASFTNSGQVWVDKRLVIAGLATKAIDRQ